MAAACVSGVRTPTLLALKQAGLEYLLLDEARARAIRDGAPEAVRNARTEHSSRIPPREGALRAETGAPNAAPDPAPDPAAWPTVWRERLQKTRAAPLVWTYWELGGDLCIAPDPQRRDLLQAI
ncbi:MAG: hypothetical protein LBC79_00580, partial [Deltaproteobacteria bacterium]|nr:hypothetical protein [Deltaproteobacteria bacterium]